MFNWYNLVSLYLWVAPHALLAPLGIFLFRRRLHLKFPIFFGYVCYEIVEFITVFTMSRFEIGNLYLRVFLITWAISASLRFGVIQEIFNIIFHRHGRIDVLARTSLRWITVVLLVAAVLVSAFAPAQASNSLIAAAAWVGRGVAIIQCGIVLFLFLFSGILGLSLDSFVFGIALGFGISSSAELAYFAMRTRDISLHMGRAVNLLPTGGYHIAVLLWLGYLLVPAREVVQSAKKPSVSDVNQWNAALERFIQ
jgi:hypothetical protein